MSELGLPDHYTGLGDVVALEQRLKELYQMRYALAVSSASAGLMGLALALDLRDGSFLTTPYTWGGSVAAWMMLGNRPIFADIDPMTLTLNPDSARRRFRRGVRAILSVDIYGYPADQQALRRFADEHGLFYIADCAQSLGAKRLGKLSGVLADALVLSFTDGKPLQAGEGGAVLTNNQTLYERLLWFTQHPARQRRELGLNLDNEFALNARIHPTAASRALNSLPSALDRIDARQKRALSLLEGLQERQLIQPQRLRDSNISPSFHRVTVSPTAILPFECHQPPVRLLYEQAAFQAQYAQSLRGISPCPEAEKQQATRLEIVMPVEEARSGYHRMPLGG